MRTFLSEARLAELWVLARQDQPSLEAITEEESPIFEQYRSINGVMLSSWESAPVSAVELAKSIAPKSTRTFLIGKLIRPNPTLGFARGLVSQVQFEADSVRVRMQVEEVSNGWRIWGRVNEPGWSIWSGKNNEVCDANGDFELEVQSSSVEPLSLQSESVIILLPLSEGDSGDGSA